MKLLSSLCLVLTFLVSQETPKWMRYPAISPDGSHVVFSYQGDLFLVSSDGGEAKRLTTHPDYDFNPIWSPNGESIAFASNRFGGNDVFTLNIQTATLTRLTFNSASEIPDSYTPDGKYILFHAALMDQKENVQFPSQVLSELYRVPVAGGRVSQLFTTPAISAVYNKNQTALLYYDVKSYENKWRKHHKSSAARDIWRFDLKETSHKKLTTFEGEDRDPVFTADEKGMYYLTEESGSFNVAKMDFTTGTTTALTTFKQHPVRFLSVATNGLMCFSYHGELYTLKEGEAPKKVTITLFNPSETERFSYKKLSSGASEIAVSPNGKELAFVYRGEIFVTSVEYKTTKQITHTPEQERSVSFSPDGRSLLYAGERNGSWNLYESKLLRKSEKYFFNAMYIGEKAILESPAETFQPSYSPNGKDVAFLEERTTLRVIHLSTSKVRTILDGTHNYSYRDGDQYYEWSPDGNWFLVKYFESGGWFLPDIGIVDSKGEQRIVNLTNSGYEDRFPHWAMNGEMLIWFSDRNGMRNHGSWGTQDDVYGMFFTQDAYDKFTLSKEEYELLKEKEKDKPKEKKKSKKKTSKEEKTLKPLKIDLKNIENRKLRLTINSSSLADAYMLPTGEKLFYLSRFEKGYNVWVHDFKEKSTKLVTELNSSWSKLMPDEGGKHLYLLNKGKIVQIDTKTTKQKSIPFASEMKIDHQLERAYMFEHVWRQVKKKFYDPKLHGIDWNFYKKEYASRLPFIKNNQDFSELLSELLGELNASHTGAGYHTVKPDAEQTPYLGILIDYTYTGDGIRIDEVIEKGPFTKADSKVKAGDIIERIDGVKITREINYEEILNRKTNRKVVLTLYNPERKQRWDEITETISWRENYILLYDRWVDSRRKETERLSDGQVGYVHVKGMNTESFREVYSEVIGRNRNKKAIIIDTRFNGGGWLHDDLVTLLSGIKYAEFAPRGQYVGNEPFNKWTKKSAVIVNEGNYSDAHGFPFAYKALNIGEVIGMPVPGTMTAVWWEDLIDSDIYFGIPQVGVRDLEGNYQENLQLEPDHLIANDYESVSQGRDKQLEKAIEVLLNK